MRHVFNLPWILEKSIVDYETAVPEWV